MIYREEFQSNDLRELEKEEHAHQNQETTSPKIGGVEIVTSEDVLVASDRSGPGRCTEKRTDLVGTKSIRILGYPTAIAGNDVSSIARQLVSIFGKYIAVVKSRKAFTSMRLNSFSMIPCQAIFSVSEMTAGSSDEYINLTISNRVQVVYPEQPALHAVDG